MGISTGGLSGEFKTLGRRGLGTRARPFEWSLRLRVSGEATGRAPHRWLLELRIEKAQDLLLSSTMEPQEIAAVCGF
jgi:transcriptional regulator GlxA family with amidase domain